MNQLDSVISIVLIALSGPLASAPVQDTSKHISIEYRGVTIPDSLAFTSLLRDIRKSAETLSRKELEDWVFLNMNMTYDYAIKAWVTPQVETLRHSRKDIRRIAVHLLDVAEESNEVAIRSQRELMCPSEGFSTMEQRYEALERRDTNKRVDGDFYLDDTMEKLGEKVGADLRAWLSREKQGHRIWQFNYRTLWAGRERELDAQFADFCSATGDEK